MDGKNQLGATSLKAQKHCNSRGGFLLVKSHGRSSNMHIARGYISVATLVQLCGCAFVSCGQGHN